MIDADVKQVVETVIAVLTAVGAMKGGSWAKDKWEERKNGKGKIDPPTSYPPHYEILTTDQHNNMCRDRLKPLHDEVKGVRSDMKEGFTKIDDNFKEIWKNGGKGR